jgi:16S rRNA (uracil1498-N3)-methyltransferase
VTVRRIHFPVPEPAPAKIELDAAGAHYLARVLRLGVGESIEVFDGRGHAFAATIDVLLERSAQLSLGAARASTVGRQVIILQALPKADKLEWVLQKGTELGANAFMPILTERTTVKPPPERHGERTLRWKRILEEAAKQCGRFDVPTIAAPAPLESALAELPSEVRLVVLDEEERATRLGAALENLPAGAPLGLVVGPEGGLARGEVQAMVGRGGLAVSLGERILRTETAAIAALAVIRHRDGELG